MRHLELLHPWAFALLILLLPVVVWVAWTTFDSMRRTRKLLVLAARALVVISVVAGLASVRWWHRVPEQKLCVLAAVDVSRSIPAAALDEALPRIEQLLASADASHAVGLIVFAADARVAIPPATTPPAPGALRAAIDAARAPGEPGALDLDATRVERALDVAAGVFPPGFGRRIVLFSDGNATDGDALGKAARCRAAEIDVSTVLLRPEQAAFDLAVTAVALPTSIQPGVGFDVTVQAAARAECDATLTLYRNGYLLEERPLRLPAGPHKEVFRQRLDEPGLYLYRARIACARQTASLENKTAFGFTRLRAMPKVLVLGETQTEAQHLIAGLQQNNVRCEFRPADGAPENLPDLLDFDAVVLNNLRSASLGTPRQHLLRDYVELFGGALLVIGLDAVGGYSGSPVEEALPVVCDPSRLEPASTAVMVVADTSRSLILADRDERQAAGAGASELVSRPEIIKRTARQILAGLSERDYFGLIGFGSEQYPPGWVVRPQKVYDRNKMEAALDEHLQTQPRFPDVQALADLVGRMAAPAAPLPPEQLAHELEALADPLHRPHFTSKVVMPFFRNKLKATREALNPEELTQALERLLEPNAFLARSNASISIARAVAELKTRQTAQKRIILLSDGYLEGGDTAGLSSPAPAGLDSQPKAKETPSQPTPRHEVDYDRLAGQLAADGITLSTVALKEADANTPLLARIARWGRGQCYRVDDAAAFGAEFRRQLAASGQPRVMEFPFRPRKVADSLLLRGVDVAVAPQLFGYVRTVAKLGARTVLAAGPDNEPLLSSWEFGAGRAAVFTSDAQERWASLWIRDWPEGYQRLWGGVVQALCERPAERRLLPQLDVLGPRVELAVDFVDSANRFLNGETVQARFYYLGEEGFGFSRTAAEDVPLRQVAPGRYAARYRAARKGIYLARVSAGPRETVTSAFVVSLLAEDATLTADAAAMQRWAAAGGGQCGGAPPQWASLSGKTRESPVEISRWAMVLAALLFTADVLLRRWPALSGFLRAKGARR